MVDDDRIERDVTGQLGYVLRIAQAAIWRDLVSTFEPFGIRPQQYAALSRIEQTPDITLEALAQALGIRSPNLVGIIEELVSRGLVDRVRPVNDRRATALRLTEAGTLALGDLRRADDRHEAALHRLFGRERLEALIDDLSLLANFSS